MTVAEARQLVQRTAQIFAGPREHGMHGVSELGGYSPVDAAVAARLEVARIIANVHDIDRANAEERLDLIENLSFAIRYTFVDDDELDAIDAAPPSKAVLYAAAATTRGLDENTEEHNSWKALEAMSEFRAYCWAIRADSPPDDESVFWESVYNRLQLVYPPESILGIEPGPEFMDPRPTPARSAIQLTPTLAPAQVGEWKDVQPRRSLVPTRMPFHQWLVRQWEDSAPIDLTALIDRYIGVAHHMPRSNGTEPRLVALARARRELVDQVFELNRRMPMSVDFTRLTARRTECDHIVKRYTIQTAAGDNTSTLEFDERLSAARRRQYICWGLKPLRVALTLVMYVIGSMGFAVVIGTAVAAAKLAVGEPFPFEIRPVITALAIVVFGTAGIVALKDEPEVLVDRLEDWVASLGL